MLLKLNKILLPTNIKVINILIFIYYTTCRISGSPAW